MVYLGVRSQEARLVLSSVTGFLLAELVFKSASAPCTCFAKPFDGVFEGTFPLAIIPPCLALADLGCCRSDGEALRIKISFHLRPSEGHRNQSAWPRPRRQGCDSCRHAIVAQIVQEYAPVAEFLRHVHQVAVPIVLGHPRADLTGKALRDGPGCDTPLRRR